MLYALEETGPNLCVAHRYFPTGEARAWDDPGTYLGGGTVEHTRAPSPSSRANSRQDLSGAEEFAPAPHTGTRLRND